MIIPFGHLGLKIYPKGLLMSIEKKKKEKLRKKEKKNMIFAMRLNLVIHMKCNKMLMHANPT